MPKKTFSEEMERRFMKVCSISCEFEKGEFACLRYDYK